jgi:hypothetical protein
MPHSLIIVSGGQTGVDRAALDFALKNSIPCGGYCPKDRKAEDGPISLEYPLTELQSDQYQDRTEANVKSSDGTLILTWQAEPGKGSQETIACCNKYQKPYYVCEIEQLKNIDSFCNVHQWIIRNRIRKLNIAGNRESEDPGIYTKTLEALDLLFNL